jgi:hypothetical protein
METESLTQSQNHGFIFENIIREKVFGLPIKKNDTSIHDISSHENIFDQTENISIKISCNGDIGCGDILRFYSYDFTQKNTIIVGIYKQVNEDQKCIEVIYEIDYNKKFHDLLFGEIGEEEIVNYMNIVKSIPPGTVKPEDKLYLKLKEHYQKGFDMKIVINPKVDSKSQRRVQATIPKIEQLLEKNPEFIISKTTFPNLVLRGVEINATIESKRRIRSSH